MLSQEMTSFFSNVYDREVWRVPSRVGSEEKRRDTGKYEGTMRAAFGVVEE